MSQIVIEIRFFSLIFLCVSFTSVQANEITVDTLTDAADALVGDGICATPSGQCTLRAAISEANHNGLDNLILLPSGEINISVKGLAEDQNDTGDLDILGAIQIIGASDKTTINGNEIDRLFEVFPNADLNLKNLVLTGAVDGFPEQNHPENTGSVLKVHPSAQVELYQVDIRGNSSLSLFGTLILQQGFFSAEKVTLVDNLNSHAIWIDGPETRLKKCLITGHNRQVFIIEGIDGFAEHDLISINGCSFVGNNSQGAGLMFVGSHILNIDIINSTISNNTSPTALIINDNGSQLFINQTTIYQNNIDDLMVIHDVHGPGFAATYLSNSLVSNNAGVKMQFLGGGHRSLGGNYFGVISDGINQHMVPLESDVVDDSEPEILAELIQYNPYSVIMFPLDDAPVIDIGVSSGCNKTDQINQIRSKPMCDAGAIEWYSDLIFQNSFEL